MAHARGKAREVAERVGIPDGGGVLGVDTEVVLDGRVCGKATGRDEAAAMLRSLSGRAHAVMTAVVLITDGGETDALAHAEVHMHEMDDACIARYLDAGEWQGRAGSYAVQGRGSDLIARLVGDATTVIGLPTAEVTALLVAAGLRP